MRAEVLSSPSARTVMYELIDGEGIYVPLCFSVTEKTLEHGTYSVEYRALGVKVTGVIMEQTPSLVVIEYIIEPAR